MQLVCHRSTPSPLIDQIEVMAERHADGRLWLRYHVEMPLESLALPEETARIRTNDLWRTTCFEAFLSAEGAPDYVEYNASPSGAWAAYHFAGYRDGMIDLAVANTPEIGLDASDSHFALEVDYDVPPAWAALPLRLGLSVVIEEQDGTKSYWALAHPPGKPDFHHGDCFVLHLAAPEQP